MLMRRSASLYQPPGRMTKTPRFVVAGLRLAWVVSAGSLATLAVHRDARAEGPARDPSVEAKRLFAEGSALYLAGQYEGALAALERSHQLLASPNSELVMARCLRELGRLVEAREAFESAELEAHRRAIEGAPRYAQTADSAASEGAAVRASLGTIRVRIEGVDSSAKLTIDAVPTEVAAGEIVVWHVPGQVAVSMRSSSGLEQRQVVTVRAGVEVAIGFGAPKGASAEPTSLAQPDPRAQPLVESPRRPPDRAGDRAPGKPAPAWAFPALVVSGGVTLVGAAIFAGFGIAANDEFRKLQRFCAQGCSPADKPKANAGKTDQLVANIALGATSVAAAATGTFAVIALSHPGSRPNSQVRWHLLVGATALDMRCEFP